MLGKSFFVLIPTSTAEIFRSEIWESQAVFEAMANLHTHLRHEIINIKQRYRSMMGKYFVTRNQLNLNA